MLQSTITCVSSKRLLGSVAVVVVGSVTGARLDLVPQKV
jgi:hypothetical protein